MMIHNPTIDPEQWLTALRKNGNRVTNVQEVLVRILICAESPMSAEQLWKTARQLRPETGRATVYRMVEKLESLDLLRRVHGYQGCNHFLPTVPESTILFICLDCGYTDYLDSQPLDDLIQHSEFSSGHHVTDSRLQLFGIYASCQQNN